MPATVAQPTTVIQINPAANQLRRETFSFTLIYNMSIRRLLAGKLYPTIFSKRSITDSAGAYLPRKGKSYITHLPTNSKLNVDAHILWPIWYASDDIGKTFNFASIISQLQRQQQHSKLTKFASIFIFNFAFILIGAKFRFDMIYLI